METTQISAMIDRIMTGDPWHGPSVRSLLQGIGAAEAARPGPGGTHSIWELVRHMTGWAREVTTRVGGRAAQAPDDGDWPTIGEVTEERWASAQADLFGAHRDLMAAIARLDPAALDRPMLDYRDNALGTGLSHYLTLHGIVQHTVYHAGQIALLRRLRSR